MPCKSFFFDTKSFEAVPQTTLEGARSPKVTFFVTQKEKYGSKCRQNIFGCNFENDTHVNAFCWMYWKIETAYCLSQKKRKSLPFANLFQLGKFLQLILILTCQKKRENNPHVT